MIQKSQLLADHSASAIQMLEAQNEELREEIEVLRSQLESVNTGQHVNGNVSSGSSPMTTSTALPQSNGTYRQRIVYMY